MPGASLVRRVLDVFDDGRSGRAAWLVALLLFGAALETVGVGLILPFIALVAEPSVVVTNPWLARAYELSPAQDPTTFFWLFALGMLAFYVFKNVCVGLVAWRSNAAIFGRMHAVFTRLMSRYMHEAYTFHLANASSDLQRNINHDVVMAFNWVVAQCFLLVRDALLVGLLLAMLFVVEPVATLAAAAAIAIPGGLFVLLTKNLMTRFGRDERRHFAAMIKWIAQGVGGIKEARVLGKEDYFVENFDRHARRYALTRRNAVTVNEMPRLVLETVAVAGMLVVVLATLAQGRAMQAVLPSLAMFAVAAFRLLPAATRSVRAWNLIRHHRESLEQVWRDLEACRAVTAVRDAGASPPPPFATAISLVDAEVRYAPSDTPAIRGVNVEIRCGEAVALVGPSGAGKTTVVDALLGLLPLARGRLLVDGVEVAAGDGAWRRRFGYIPQQIYLVDDTLRQNVAFGEPAVAIDDARVLAALRAAQLEAFVASLPEGLDTPLGENGVRLSGGQRQRIGIARALYPDPDVLVLDEATAALDPETEAAVSEAITSLAGRKTLVVIAHRMSTVRRCERLFFLVDGQVAAEGTYDELLEGCARFRAMASAGAERAAALGG